MGRPHDFDQGKDRGGSRLSGVGRTLFSSPGRFQ